MAYFIKQQLQAAPPTSNGNLSEVNLFRQMMFAFKFFYGATVIVNETHQNYVGFDTTNPKTNSLEHNKTKEISDLHIITYSPSRKIARETYLQAKVARGKDGLQPNGTFTFHGDWFQYDLLSRRPRLLQPNKKKAYWRLLCNPDFLHSAILPSIGSYGVFYQDQNKQIDFAYQPANVLNLQTPYTTIGQFCINTHLQKYNSPNIIPDLQYSYDVDEFEYAVTHNLLGSPLQLCRYVPCYHCYRIFRDNFWAFRFNNDDRQIKEVIAGFEEFEHFIIENESLFGRNDNVERYSELTQFTEYTELPENNKEQIHRNNEYNIDNLCKGPISLVLLNTDKI